MTDHAPLLALLLPIALLAAGCGDDTAADPTGTTTTTTTTTSTGTGGAGGDGGGGGVGGGCDVTAPETYDGDAYDVNAAIELTVRDQFNAFNDLMRSAEIDLAITPSQAELTALYEAGDPSVRDLTTAYYKDRVLELLADFEAAAGNTWVPDAQPAGPGGKYGNYLFTARGTDLRQAVEKGLFGAAFHHHARAITAGPVDEVTVDRLLAAYGAHPTFPGDSGAVDPVALPYPDRLIAQYAERRSPKNAADSSKPADPENPGPYFRIKADLILAKAAARAGAACDQARDEAIARVMTESERVLFSTVIFYLNDAALKLTKENPTVGDLSGGLHGYGEAVSFVHGFRGLPADARAITDAQIDALLAQVGAPAGGEATSYRLLTDTAAEVPNLVAAIQMVADIYGFSPQDIEAFKLNH